MENLFLIQIGNFKYIVKFGNFFNGWIFLGDSVIIYDLRQYLKMFGFLLVSGWQLGVYVLGV